jgi:hypothetical protein
MTTSNKIALPPELKAVFDNAIELLNNEETQNSFMPEPQYSLIVGGLDCDELPDAQGEFGRSLDNPIPVNGLIGQVIYLSRLLTTPRWHDTLEAGSPVMFHRLGSARGASGMVDLYEVLSLDGTVRETLYLSMYHPRKSRKAPLGYNLASSLDSNNITYGVNHFVEHFPQNLDAYIRKWQMAVFGIPFPVHRVRETINGSRFNISTLVQH